VGRHAGGGAGTLRSGSAIGMGGMLCPVSRVKIRFHKDTNASGTLVRSGGEVSLRAKGGPFENVAAIRN
jgi:hypothetical protein